MADEVKVQITVDDVPARQAFKRLEKGSDDFASNFQKGMGNAVSSFNVFEGAVAAGLVLKGLDAIKNVALGLFDVFVIQGVQASLKYEESLNRLNVALAATGIYSKGLSADLEALAQKTQETTKYSDDMVLSAAAQLQTVARLSGEGLQRATRDTIDLAAAINVDLITASELVAKAHEGQTNALRRQGIVISETIAPTEKYGELLRIIETRFAGTAQAQAITYAGRIEILKNQFEDAQKSIGNYITKNEAVRAVLKVGTDQLALFTGALIENKEAMNSLVTEGVFKTLDAIVDLLDSMQTVSTVFQVAFSIMSAGWNSIRFAVEEMAAIVATVIGNLGEKIVGVFGKFVPESVRGAIDAIKEFAKDSQEAGEKSGARVADAWDNAGKAIDESATGIFKKSADKIRELSAQAQIEAKKIAEASTDPKNNPNAKGGESDQARQERVEREKAKADLDKILADTNAERLNADAQFRIAMGEGRLQDIQDQANYEAQKIQNTLDAELKKAELETTSALKQRARDKANADASLAIVKLENKTKIDLKKQELADQEAFFNTASTLSSAKNKELAAIGKAASITQIAIKTPPAVASSFEFGTKLGGPPLGFAFGAIAATAMAAQAANIAGVKFEQGGIVPGLNQFGDNVQVRVNPGEVILNNTQQKELLNVANGRSNNSSGNQLAVLVDAIKNQVINISIDGREIARVVRDQRAAGFAV
jgi:hypothetical protein